MGWTVVFYVLLLGGFAALAVGGIGLLPECRVRPDGVQICGGTMGNAARSFYETLFNAGFAVAALGALGLLGRFTGLLRR